VLYLTHAARSFLTTEARTGRTATVLPSGREPRTYTFAIATRMARLLTLSPWV
jgi:hypothetical protein